MAVEYDALSIGTTTTPTSGAGVFGEVLAVSPEDWDPNCPTKPSDGPASAKARDFA